MDMYLVNGPEIAKAVGRPLPDPYTTGDVERLLASLSEDEKKAHLPTSGEVLAEYLPKMRNELAHPGGFNRTLLARTPIEAYQQAAAILNEFWPLPTK
jgi:hypothetical protein